MKEERLQIPNTNMNLWNWSSMPRMVSSRNPTTMSVKDMSKSTAALSIGPKTVVHQKGITCMTTT